MSWRKSRKSKLTLSENFSSRLSVEASKTPLRERGLKSRIREEERELRRHELKLYLNSAASRLEVQHRCCMNKHTQTIKGASVTIGELASRKKAIQFSDSAGLLSCLPRKPTT
jgi:hypothetical protein